MINTNGPVNIYDPGASLDVTREGWEKNAPGQTGARRGLECQSFSLPFFTHDTAGLATPGAAARTAAEKMAHNKTRAR